MSSSSVSPFWTTTKNKGNKFGVFMKCWVFMPNAHSSSVAMYAITTWYRTAATTVVVQPSAELWVRTFLCCSFDEGGRGQGTEAHSPRWISCLECDSVVNVSSYLCSHHPPPGQESITNQHPIIMVKNSSTLFHDDLHHQLHNPLPWSWPSTAQPSSMIMINCTTLVHDHAHQLHKPLQWS